MKRYIIIGLLTYFFVSILNAQKIIPVGEGWANNSVNTVVFRKNSLVTHHDMQFISYYDAEGYVVLAKRRLNQDIWEINRTQYRGNVNDAHNSISIAVDGDGFLHVAWDHHGNPLNYSRSVSPLSLQLGNKMEMTSINETNITYPEFHKMPNGDIIFMYRDGQSGNGNLVLNRYSVKDKKWSQIQNNLIDGENQRNAYWQSCVDAKGVIHVSWVWRETWDVSTNHDMCYARSEDGGITWNTSSGKDYSLPITAGTAEYCLMIPQERELINQTSMTTDDNGNPYIATYFRSNNTDIPQYHIIYLDNGLWKNIDLKFRTMPFSLSGGGTKSIPISRPQVISKGKGSRVKLMLIFRDKERDSKVSVATCTNIKRNKWKVYDLTDFSVGSWEPTYDIGLWNNKNKINLFVQENFQVDGEGVADVGGTMVSVLELNRIK